MNPIYQINVFGNNETLNKNQAVQMFFDNFGDDEGDDDLTRRVWGSR